MKESNKFSEVREHGLPPISRTHRLSTLQIFELYWADVADSRVPAFRVVEPFNVIEDISTQFVAGTVPAPTQAFCLQSGEETFHCGVIPAITAAAHTASDAVRFQ